MAIVFALLAALTNAFATVLQRLGVEDAGSARAEGRRLMASLLRRPVWYLGLGLTTGSFLCHALALANGNLSTVQPIQVTEILFLVAILGIWFGHAIGWREWVGTTGTCIGLGTFLALSGSSGGDERPTRPDWVLLLIACVGAVVLTAAAGRRGPRAWKAAMYGVSAAICFALTAAFLKVTTDQWTIGSGWHLFLHLEVYGVAISGLGGLVLSQHALEAGPIAASQSALLIVNPLVSIVMGIWLFGDHVHHGGARTIVEALALGVMFLGLFVLSTSPLINQSARAERLSEAATT